MYRKSFYLSTFFPISVRPKVEHYGCVITYVHLSYAFTHIHRFFKMNIRTYIYTVLMLIIIHGPPKTFFF